MSVLCLPFIALKALYLNFLEFGSEAFSGLDQGFNFFARQRRRAEFSLRPQVITGQAVRAVGLFSRADGEKRHRTVGVTHWDELSVGLGLLREYCPAIDAA